MGDDISLSVEESNKLREKLGLKPLQIEQKAVEKQQEPQLQNKDEIEQTAQEEKEELIQKIYKSRESRQTADATRAAKTLAQEAEEEGDVVSWLERQREAEVQKQQQEGSEEEEEAEDEGDEDGPGAKKKQKVVDKQGSKDEQGLKGMKVKHRMDEMLKEGETVILTMADKSILDDKGLLRDDGEDDEEIVVEEVLTRQQRERERARNAAKKKEHGTYDEYGNRRSILDKYDEEENEEDDTMQITDSKTTLEQQINQKLQQGLSALSESQPVSDFMTAAETSKKNMDKKSKKKKKLRKKQVDAEEDEEGGGGLDYDALEAEAIAKQAQGGDLGSRPTRGQKAEEEFRKVQEREVLATERYKEAKEKANLQSEILKATYKKQRVLPIGEEFEQEFLVLNQPSENTNDKNGDTNKKLSAEKRLEEFSKRAIETAVKVEQQQITNNDGQGESGVKLGNDKSLVFQEIGEFARGFDYFLQPIKQEEETGLQNEQKNDGNQVNEEPKNEEPKKVEGGDGQAMDVVVKVEEQEVKEEENKKESQDDDKEEAEAEDDDDGEEIELVVEGNWIKEKAVSRKDRIYRKKKEAEQQQQQKSNERNRKGIEGVEGITREGDVGQGLAHVLQMMKSRGTLNEVVEYAGRTNDKKKSKLVGLDEVFQGGMGEEELERSIEVALAKKDQFGRILTPKEAFRELSYRFHGMEPSRNKIEKKIRKDREELAIKKATTSDDPAAKIARLQNVHQAVGSAFIPLSGGPTPAPGMLAAAAVVAAPILGTKMSQDDRKRDNRKRKGAQNNKNQNKKQKKQKQSENGQSPNQ